ncbi:MAG TPA: AmmeMemoRadiSam system protein B [Nitrospirota bacterium]|nr:AmmeMemoRadiSam system protein B [Nitrospirota bacterium]
MLRKPAVAGYFYQASPDRLKDQVQKYVTTHSQKTRALGVISPHAGFIYSGAVAGAVYSGLILPDTFILIGPNHTGTGAPVSVFPEGRWEMPNGEVEVDAGIAKSLADKARCVSLDYDAHRGEHCIETQLPFLQYIKGNFKIIPIVMMSTSIDVCKELGHAISRTIQEAQRDVLIVASSDMTHYESADAAKEKDHKAIEKILALDPAGLHAVVKEYGITMCGFAPAVTMLYAAMDLGATKARLVKYMNSGDTSGDYDQVVGYAGIVVQ